MENYLLLFCLSISAASLQCFLCSDYVTGSLTHSDEKMVSKPPWSLHLQETSSIAEKEAQKEPGMFLLRRTPRTVGTQITSVHTALMD